MVPIITTPRLMAVGGGDAAVRLKGLAVIGFAGQHGGEMAAPWDLCLRAPAASTPLIQQLHITAGLIVCGLVEARLFPCTG
jgi:D-sedoheptulose 7-phosphate isomerase